MESPFFNSSRMLFPVGRDVKVESLKYFCSLEGGYGPLNISKLEEVSASGKLQHSLICPISDYSNALLVTSSIEENTTNDAFDEILRLFQDYKLENGNGCRMNALCTAALVGNHELVEHILKIGREHLLNLGSDGRKTPLMHAASCKNIHNGFKVAEVLLNHKANIVAMCTDDNSFTWSDWTAVNYALDVENLPLVLKLIRNGGLIRRKLSKKHQKTLDSAMRILFERFLALKNDLPKELVYIIIDQGIELDGLPEKLQ